MAHPVSTRTPEEKRLHDIERKRAWRAANKEKIAAYKAKDRVKRAEDIAAYNIEYREKNADRIAEKKAAWTANNLDRVRRSKSRWVQRKYGEDIQFRFARNVRARVSSALRKAGVSKSTRSMVQIGCTIPELRAHLEKHFVEGMSWDNYGEWVVDHVTPIGAFDLNCPLQLHMAAGFWNLQPLWYGDNLRKVSSDRKVIAESRLAA